MTVKIGLVGVGRMGRNHLRVLSLLKGVSLEWVHDQNPAVTQAVAQERGIRAQPDFDRGIQEVDAVVIVTPTSTHSEFIRRAAAKVKTIFIEKPMTASLAEDREIVRLAKDQQLRVQVGFIERFNPVVQELRKVIEGAEVIQMDFTRTNSLGSHVKDVDVITDLMIHDIDLALHLNGPVESVSAAGRAEGGLVAIASAVLKHKNGVLSRIHASRVTERKIRHIQATCRGMYVDCELLRKEIAINRQSTIKQERGRYSVASTEERVEVQPHEALLDELQAFVALARGEAVQVPSPEQAIAAMEVCAQIQAEILRGGKSGV